LSLLSTVTTGKRIKPIAVLLHGVHGIGKSTFGEESNKPIFIGPEENDELDAARFPKVTSWGQLLNQLKTLQTDDHDFKTVVIDTIDTLEQVAQKLILSGKDKDKTMATAMGGFGKAYEKQREMFIDLRDSYIIPLREIKGMNIIILAHSERVMIEDPMTNTTYTKWETAIHKKCKPVFEDWVSAILFATYENFKTERSDGKEVAVGDGSRLLFTEERPSHIAKNRFSLESEIEMTKGEVYRDFSAQVKAFYKGAKKAETKTQEKEVIPKELPSDENDSITEFKIQIEHLMKNFEGDQLEKITMAYKRAKNEKQLEKVLKRIQKTLA